MNEAISMITYVFINLIKGAFRLFRMILPFLIVIIIYIVGKAIYRYFKYGYKEFNIFKKRNSLNYKQELLFFMLSKLNGYRKIITLKELNSHIAVIDETGIYLLYIFNYDGLIYGNTSDNYLSKKSIDHQILKISNPFFVIEKDKNIILKKLGPINVYKYIVINNTCILDVIHDNTISVVYFKDFFHKIELPLKNNKKIYNKNDINKYCKMISGNVK